MTTEIERIRKAADYIRSITGRVDIGIVLGSGLGSAFSSLKNTTVIKYSDIPGFPIPTVFGHTGEWIACTCNGKRIAMLNGRFHYYEGHPMADIVFPVRVLHELGAKAVILTNAAGGVNTSYKPGDLMLINDFINFGGLNPLIGANIDELGPRFPDMCAPLPKDYIALAKECAADLGQTLQEGVYVWMSGPSFETPAEIRMVRTLGADAVGMSTVPEIIACRHMGVPVLGISCITNMAAGILDQPLTHDEVLETGKRVQDQFAKLVWHIFEKFPL